MYIGQATAGRRTHPLKTTMASHRDAAGAHPSPYVSCAHVGASVFGWEPLTRTTTTTTSPDSLTRAWLVRLPARAVASPHTHPLAHTLGVGWAGHRAFAPLGLPAPHDGERCSPTSLRLPFACPPFAIPHPLAHTTSPPHAPMSSRPTCALLPVCAHGLAQVGGSRGEGGDTTRKERL